LTNDVLGASYFFLLGSNCSEHPVKVMFVHPRSDLNDLETNQNAEHSFIQDVKTTIAGVHSTTPTAIVVMSHMARFITSTSIAWPSIAEL
jgi:hypothetical protein